MRQSPSLTTALVCKPWTAGLRRLWSAPAGKRTFPTLSLQSLSRCLDPYPATFPGCMDPLLPRGLRPHLRVERFGTPEDLCKATFAEGVFRGCSHSLIFRLPNLLGPQIAPTARPLSVLGGRAVYTRPNSEPLPAQSTGIATCLKRAIGTAGLAPAGLQPCRLLPTPDPFSGRRG